MPRFFAELINDTTAVIKGNDAAHITGSLRLTQGDLLKIRDDNQGYSGKIKSIDRGSITIDIIDNDTLVDRTDRKIHIGICIIALKDMDTLIRYLTELGVADVQPIVSTRSNIRKIKSTRYRRWNDIVMESIKQCQRKTIPIIHEVRTLTEFAAMDTNWQCRLVASQHAERSLDQCRDNDTGIIIGPEGGFTPEEMTMLTDRGFETVSMGNTVLRSVTAAISAAAILAA